MFPFIIPSIEVYGKAIKKWRVVKLRGTTVFIPDEGAEYSVVELASNDYHDQLIDDFLKLGNLLFERYKDCYRPLLYVELKKKHKEFENRITWSDSAVEYLMSDSQSVFCKNDDIQASIESVLEFISKYGCATRRLKTEAITMSQMCWEKWLLEDFNIQCRSFRIISAEYLIQEFLSRFTFFCKPDFERERIIELYGHNIYNECEGCTNISLNSKYDYTNKRIVANYTVFDLFEYIDILLCLINIDLTQKRIGTCPNCGKVFLLSNKKNIYCSTVCRNRANVKKSYYRKKNG